jgi:hypothetical protein
MRYELTIYWNNPEVGFIVEILELNHRLANSLPPNESLRMKLSHHAHKFAPERPASKEKALLHETAERSMGFVVNETEEVTHKFNHGDNHGN